MWPAVRGEQAPGRQGSVLSLCFALSFFGNFPVVSAGTWALASLLMPPPLDGARPIYGTMSMKLLAKETWSLLGSMRPAISVVSLVLAGFIRALPSEACWRPRGFWMESADRQWVCPGKQEGEIESARPPSGRGLQSGRLANVISELVFWI